MSKILRIDEKEHNSSLYDITTGKRCVTEKVVDITEDCPEASETERAILLFTRTKRGRIVQISQPYEDEVYMGLHIHFFIDELDHEMFCVVPRDDTFGSTADRLGLTKSQLRSLIEAHVPA